MINTIKVIIADDHQMVIDGLSSILNKEDKIDIVAQALNGNEVLKVLESQHIDIVIMDIEMPELSGLETAKIIKEKYPLVKILILSMYNTKTFVQYLIEIGVDGYILKNKGKEELVMALNYIAQDGEFFGREVEKTFRSYYRKQKDNYDNVRLTNREKDVIKLIAIGDTTPEISKKLFIAHSTVESHRRHLIEKTGVKNSKALVKYAIENGYL